MKIENKGITLISLVITIILMLILAGVVIATVVGDNRNNSKSKTSKRWNRKSKWYRASKTSGTRSIWYRTKHKYRRIKSKPKTNTRNWRKGNSTTANNCNSKQ